MPPISAPMYGTGRMWREQALQGSEPLATSCTSSSTEPGPRLYNRWMDQCCGKGAPAADAPLAGVCNQGVRGMRVGGQRKLLVPPNLVISQTLDPSEPAKALEPPSWPSRNECSIFASFITILSYRKKV